MPADGNPAGIFAKISQYFPRKGIIIVSAISSQRTQNNYCRNNSRSILKNKNHKNKPSRQNRKSASRFWLTISAFIPGVALALSLLGYGVATAVESTFGVPHSHAYDSTIDLLSLSSYTIMAAIDLSAKVLEGQELKAITYHATIFGLVFAALFIALRTKINLDVIKIKHFKIWLLSNRVALLFLGIGTIPRELKHQVQHP